MNCPRQSAVNSMATLLQQQNCMKTLTANNGVVNNGNGSTNVGVVASPSTSATSQLTATVPKHMTGKRVIMSPKFVRFVWFMYCRCFCHPKYDVTFMLKYFFLAFLLPQILHRHHCCRARRHPAACHTHIKHFNTSNIYSIIRIVNQHHRRPVR